MRLSLAGDAIGRAQGANLSLIPPPLRRGAILLALLLIPGAAIAAERCSEMFADGRRPALSNPKLGAGALPLCRASFSLLYSPQSRTPLYAAERLTRGSVTAARAVDRIESFHEDENLPAGARSRVDDYARSGFDRGHMAPAGDMPTGAAQAESFSLANVAPQDRALNRGLWGGIEESVRRLALAREALFVVTGPVFAGESARAINGRVLVPTHLFKAVHDPATGEAGAYLAENRAEGGWRVVSLRELSTIAGLDVFPGLSDRAKGRAMILPAPLAYGRAAGHDETSWQAWAKAELHRLARRLWRDLLRAIF